MKHWQIVRVALIVIVWLSIAGLMVYDYTIADPPLTPEEARVSPDEGWGRNTTGDLRNMLLLSVGEGILFLALSNFWSETLATSRLAVTLLVFIALLVFTTMLFAFGGGVETLNSSWLLLLNVMLIVSLLIKGVQWLRNRQQQSGPSQ